ncbi:MAG: DUF4169 family protein [Novosphingobium sp.]
MAEIINLRMARKARKRSEDQSRADQNRALSSRTKAEKARDRDEQDRAARSLDGHRREET